jgi:hypothetical protein
VITITKQLCKKTTQQEKASQNTCKCDVNHVLLSVVCFFFVIEFTRYFRAVKARCDLQQIPQIDGALAVTE